ncbi:unnamed protein product [Hymenolepis diminuta]|uniref:Uncharacterized protein n=1 Tax=Hymenolepis diminuta TaxID=6216 RepID=A0A564YBV8_HYMDI|nr:unnamed protein product [Hymenolepis diminuta]
MSFATSLHSIPLSPPVEIPDPAAAEDVTKIVPGFIHDHVNCKFFESWYNKGK